MELGVKSRGVSEATGQKAQLVAHDRAGDVERVVAAEGHLLRPLAGPAELADDVRDGGFGELFEEVLGQRRPVGEVGTAVATGAVEGGGHDALRRLSGASESAV